MRMVPRVRRAQRDDWVDVLSCAQAVGCRGSRCLRKFDLCEVGVPWLVQVNGKGEVLVVRE